MKKDNRGARPKYNRLDIYNWIVAYMTSSHGVQPTIREIMNGCGMKSTSVVEYAIRDLKDLGLIEIVKHKQRNFRIVGAQWIPPAPKPVIDAALARAMGTEAGC